MAIHFSSASLSSMQCPDMNGAIDLESDCSQQESLTGSECVGRDDLTAASTEKPSLAVVQPGHSQRAAKRPRQPAGPASRSAESKWERGAKTAIVHVHCGYGICTCTIMLVPCVYTRPTHTCCYGILSSANPQSVTQIT